MPHFDPFYADKLRGAKGVADADHVLDLRLSDRAGAEAALAALVAGADQGPARTLAIRLAAPIPGAGETLFQPVCRALLDAKKAGAVESLAPLPAQDGLGFFVKVRGGA